MKVYCVCCTVCTYPRVNILKMDIGTIEDDDFIQVDEESDSEEEKTVNK